MIVSPLYFTSRIADNGLDYLLLAHFNLVLGYFGGKLKSEMPSRRGIEHVKHGCHKGRCWRYCGAAYQSGQWCYTKSNYANDYHRCQNNNDCKCSYKQCWGKCSL